MTDRFSIAVVGGGPAGLTAALAVSATGSDVTLLGPRFPLVGQTADNRTAALFAGSIELLRNLGVWEALKPRSAPIAAIRIIDDTGGLLRARGDLYRRRGGPGDVRLECSQSRPSSPASRRNWPGACGFRKRGLSRMSRQGPRRFNSPARKARRSRHLSSWAPMGGIRSAGPRRASTRRPGRTPRRPSPPPFRTRDLTEIFRLSSTDRRGR